MILVRRVFSGKASCLAVLRAEHSIATGHTSQRGALGRHTVAPSSIKAWLKSPGRCLGTNLVAIFQSSFLSGPLLGSPLKENSRDKTLATLPSKAANLFPKAILMIAAAV